MEELTLAFKARLRSLITASGLTHAGIGDGSALKASSISDWANEKQTATPSVPQLIQLARFFKVTVDYLVGVSDSQNGLPPSHWLVDLDYVDALERGDHSRADNPDDVPAIPIPRRATLMSSTEYNVLRKRMVALAKGYNRDG